MRCIRRAVPADAGALAFITIETWRRAYRGLIPSSYLDRMDLAESQERWLVRLTHPDDLTLTLTLDAEKKLIGFVVVSPSRDRDTDPWLLGEVTALYVLPDYWNQGAGRTLLTAGLARLAIAGFEDVILWVFEANKRARRFYEANGWVADGKRRIYRGATLPELRYRRGGLH